MMPIQNKEEKHYKDKQEAGHYKKTAHFLAAIVVVQFLVFGVWFIQQNSEGIDFDSLPEVNKPTPNGEYKSALSVTPLVAVEPKQPEPVLSKQDTPPIAAEAPTAAKSKAKKGDYDHLLARAKKEGGEKKIELLREAITVNPDGDKALATLATLLMEKKDTRAEALSFAKRATKVNPDNGMAWLAIGYVHQLQDEKVTSKEAFKKCAACSGPKIYTRECARLAK
ncbi:MAG: hypothetical protein GY854_18940 [Deltaproteobacteria bacterium]|nr:hypothetical protein [Deltaproteobacteria bacterium]